MAPAIDIWCASSGDSAVEFRVIGDPGKQAPYANSMDRRTRSNGSTPRMEPGRDPVRGSAQRDSVLPSEGLAGDNFATRANVGTRGPYYPTSPSRGRRERIASTRSNRSGILPATPWLMAVACHDLVHLVFFADGTRPSKGHGGALKFYTSGDNC